MRLIAEHLLGDGNSEGCAIQLFYMAEEFAKKYPWMVSQEMRDILDDDGIAGLGLLMDISGALEKIKEQAALSPVTNGYDELFDIIRMITGF